jgi:hypothetical protein
MAAGFPDPAAAFFIMQAAKANFTYVGESAMLPWMTLFNECSVRLGREPCVT